MAAAKAIIAGLGIAAIGYAGRFVAKKIPGWSEKLSQTLKNLPLNSQAIGNSKYYRGGFEQKMTRREAGLILGVSPGAPRAKVKEQFKKVMSANHPDRGGSPYVAAKINEAKDILEK